MTAPGAEPHNRRSQALEALLAGAGLMAVLFVGKTFMLGLPRGPDIVFTLAAAFQLYVPLQLIAKHGEMPESHGIHVHGLLLGPVAALRRRMVLARRRRELPRGPRPVWSKTLAYYGQRASFDGRGFSRDVGFALLLALVTFPPFAVGHHFWQEWSTGRDLTFSWVLKPDLDEELLKNFLLVALPEELFYRGFIQTRLLRWWPNELSLWFIPVGRAVIVTSAIFALGHFLGEWNPARLGPFFPAFVFSALALRSKSIAGAITYHALSNVFSASLLYGYFQR